MQLEVMIRKSVAELVRTFAFFFAGISAIIKVGSTSGAAGLLVVAFTRGIMLAIMVSSLGAVSGGHLYGYLFLPKPGTRVRVSPGAG